MSLLNDALKRASDADKSRTGGGPPVSPLQPVDYAARPGWPLRFVLAGLLLVTVGCSAYFLIRWLRAPGPEPIPDSGNAPIARNLPPTSAPAAAWRAPAAAQPVPPVIPVSTSVTARAALEPARPVEPPLTRGTNPPSFPAPTSAVPSVAETVFPALKLQSIIFRLRNPSAVINGEMLGVGDTIKGARVVRIDRHTVSLEWKGGTNVLALPRL